ncbi:NGG1p interacting factor NIF3, partial [Candidatus Omnitrophota bacterium]
MKLSYLYNQAIKLGRLYDPRGNRSWQYADTSILFGSPGINVKRVLVGIDIEIGELLLADRLRSVMGLDLVISHHPEGRALATLYDVMQVQADMLKALGVDPQVAQKLLDERCAEVKRKLLPVNHMRSIDAARLLNVPFMCMHTVADNHVYYFIRKLLEKSKPARLRDILKILEVVPEYREAKKSRTGPQIISGSPDGYAGKIFVEMTGGTEGPQQVFDKLAKTGVKTLVSMHLSEQHLSKARQAGLNVVIAGHISSDNLGLNLLLDGIERRE